MDWLVFSIFALLFSYLGSIKSKWQNVFRILLIMILAYPIGFGGIDSRDHDNYTSFFYAIGNKSFSDLNFQIIGESRDVSGFEIGFVFLTYIANQCHLGEAGYFYLIAFITNILLIKVIYKFPHPTICILLYIASLFFLQETNLVRQTLATSIFIFGVQYLINEESRKYLICSFVAGLFHTAAFTLMIFVLLNKVNWKKYKNQILLSLFSLWLFSILIYLDIIHLNFVGFLSSSSIFSYYDHYLVSDIEREVNNNVVLLNDIYVICSFVYLFFMDKNIKPNYYILLLPLSGILLNFSCQFYWFYRYTYYFLPFVFICIPKILMSIEIGSFKNVGKLILCILMLRAISNLNLYFENQQAPLFNNMYTLNDVFS